MATVRATFSTTDKMIDKVYKVFIPAMVGRNASGLDELTSSGTADNMENGASEWSAPSDGIVKIRSDGDVWVSFGTSPTAAVGTDFFVPTNEDTFFIVTQGDKISVINDS
jgi:hypothetical protein